MKDWNLLIIAADALRLDYLFCYGYKKAATPNIDRLARDGIIFTNAISNSCVTPVIFSTLFTGTYPFQHGIREFSFVLTSNFSTLAEIFSRAGFRTAAILGSVVMDKSRRFDRGFQDYNDVFDVQFLYSDRRVIEDPNNAIIFRFGEVNTDLAVKWLRKNTSDPFFLFVHYWDSHVPYFPPQRFLRPEIRNYHGIIDGSVKQIEQINCGDLKIDAEDTEYLRGLYEGGVLNIDHGIGALIESLSDLGVLDRTVVVFLADHGCNLGEHDFFGNGRLLYENDLRIPLIINGPLVEDTQAEKIDGLVSSIDIFPTIIKNWGFEIPKYVRGLDFMPMVKGERAEIRNYTYSETYFPSVFENKRIAFRNKRWKLIREPRGPSRIGKFRHNLALLKVFLYRYWTNKTQRRVLRKKLWDSLCLGEKARLDSRVENAVMNRRSAVRELYDLTTDPGEENNLYYSHPDIAANYERMLNEFMAVNVRDNAFSDRLLNDEITQRLKDLGYL